jgi:gamma-glutamyltranspeptidase / glutathione hydrolase
MKRVILLLLVITLATCTVTEKQKRASAPVLADSAMVVSAHPLASKAGLEILRRGGNAVDASIATQFALAVVHPSAGNIGGGGFMVFRKANGEVETLDYREKAPGGARPSMYLDEKEIVVPDMSVKTALASGVPGTVAGLWEAHQKFGSLPWKELVQPAIDMALNGFAMTEKEARGLNWIQSDLRLNNSIEPTFLMRDEWMKGDILKLEDLGNTLIRIRDQGPDGFYAGKTADDIVAEMKRGNGIITHDDLKNYQPVWREEVTGQFRNFKIISMGPPSSGGIALLQLLKSIEPYPVKEMGHNSTNTTHLFTEAERRVYADRAAYLGDPDFFDVPVSILIETEYVKSRMATLDPEKATPSQSVKEGTLPMAESDQTTHLSIVDSKGNAVAVTTTLNDSYGSKIVVAGSGFLLNNEMDDFSVKPGHANMYGAIGGEANKILPNKRMLSSMTPTIVEKDGKLFMVVGTPGGTTIITSVFQTIVNVAEFGMNMQEAVSAARVHSQWLPDSVFAESGAFSPETLRELQARGHRIAIRDGIGRVDAIKVREDGKLEGGADPRGDDTALGY